MEEEITIKQKIYADIELIPKAKFILLKMKDKGEGNVVLVEKNSIRNLVENISIHSNCRIGCADSNVEKTIKTIEKVVFNKFSMKITCIKRRTRKKDIQRVRSLFVYLVKQQTDLTLKQIGEIVNINHATVIHSLKLMKVEIPKNESFKEVVKDVKLILNK